MPIEQTVRAQRTLRLASATAMSLALSFGLGLPIPFLSPVLTLFLAMSHRPLSLKNGLALALVAILTTGSGLLLIPVLRYYPLSGVLLIGLGLFAAFRYGLRGGNNLIMIFLVMGLTMITAAGTADFGSAVMVIGALVKGIILAVLALSLNHWLFPEPLDIPSASAAPGRSAVEINKVSLRATLIVMPTFLLSLVDPSQYLPIILKAVSLGQQSATTSREAARELLSSTLIGGLLAIVFWCALSLFVHLWMFYLWMLLSGLLLGRRLYGLRPTALSPGVWLNTFITLIILLGQSVQDSALGKDVYTAFAVRMGLFVLVTLYACLMMHVLGERHGQLSPS
jgi:hypothetical protein